MWEPLNHDAVESQPAAIPNPGELDTWSQQTFNLSRSAAIGLGFSLGSIDVKGEQRVLVAEAARYKEVPDSDNKYRLRYGVALRLVVEATDLSGDTSISLPLLAAKVQVGQARTSTNLLLRGYT